MVRPPATRHLCGRHPAGEGRGAADHGTPRKRSPGTPRWVALVLPVRARHAQARRADGVARAMRDFRDRHPGDVQRESCLSVRRWRGARGIVVACALTATASNGVAQEYGELPLLDPSMMEYGPPVTQMGGGEFFSQELGTILRIRYNTESYGQDRRGGPPRR